MVARCARDGSAPLRHRAHDLDSSYEDVQPGFSTPHGIARTSELTLFPARRRSAKAETVQQAKIAQQPPLLVAPPEYLHSARAFGIWSLPDRSTPRKGARRAARRGLRFLSEGGRTAPLVRLLELRRRDAPARGARHDWRYDIGGFAWDNTELGTDMWLWYSFLRTGRADVFRMAEAMTRHTSEVECYHLGRFARLGSRHNVRHWGCGAKEARISQAAYRRFHYYLTTDERTGDIMREVVNADFKATEIDPMRLASTTHRDAIAVSGTRPRWSRLAGVRRQLDDGMGAHRRHEVARQDPGRNGFIVAMPYGFFTGSGEPLRLRPGYRQALPLRADRSAPTISPRSWVAARWYSN